MQYVPKHTWKLLARVRQVIMAVNINLTLLHSAFNKYLNLCLQIFQHDLFYEPTFNVVTHSINQLYDMGQKQLFKSRHSIPLF